MKCSLFSDTFDLHGHTGSGNESADAKWIMTTVDSKCWNLHVPLADQERTEKNNNGLGGTVYYE